MKRHNIILAAWCAVLSLAVFSGCTEKELDGVRIDKILVKILKKEQPAE